MEWTMDSVFLLVFMRLWVEWISMGKQDDYVNQDGLQVDRGRIDRFRVLIKCHVHVGSPFLDLCVQNGSPRDGSSRWFTCGFVKGPQAPLSILILFFRDVRFSPTLRLCAFAACRAVLS